MCACVLNGEKEIFGGWVGLPLQTLFGKNEKEQKQRRQDQQQQCAIIAKYLKVYIDNVEVAGKAGKVGGKTGKFRVAHRCAQPPFPHRPRCLSAGVYPSALY